MLQNILTMIRVLYMLIILLLSGVAGILGTGLGGFIGLLFIKKTDAVLSCLLSFSGGVMMSIVFFDLIPEAMELSSVPYTVFSVIGGVMCIWIVNHLTDIIPNKHKIYIRSVLYPKDQAFKNYSKSMLKSGFLMFSAIALHNFPEGIVIGAGGIYSETMGWMLAVLIAIHDIPEGISICVPLIEGGMNRTRAILLTALSGLPTFFGGFIGIILGSINDRFIAGFLALAGGAMLYVTFVEILPRSFLMSRRYGPAVWSIAGVLFGLIAVSILN